MSESQNPNVHECGKYGNRVNMGIAMGVGNQRMMGIMEMWELQGFANCVNAVDHSNRRVDQNRGIAENVRIIGIAGNTETLENRNSWE